MVHRVLNERRGFFPLSPAFANSSVAPPPQLPIYVGENAVRIGAQCPENMPSGGLGSKEELGPFQRSPRDLRPGSA